MVEIDLAQLERIEIVRVGGDDAGGGAGDGGDGYNILDRDGNHLADVGGGGGGGDVYNDHPGGNGGGPNGGSGGTRYNSSSRHGDPGGSGVSTGRAGVVRSVYKSTSSDGQHGVTAFDTR